MDLNLQHCIMLYKEEKEKADSIPEFTLVILHICTVVFCCYFLKFCLLLKYIKKKMMLLLTSELELEIALDYKDCHRKRNLLIAASLCQRIWLIWSLGVFQCLLACWGISQFQILNIHATINLMNKLTHNYY